jgi:hypothetical protein
MKKILGLLTAMFMMSSFLMPAYVVAGVAGQYKDQAFENTAGVGFMTIGTQATHGRVQTFKPTANKITSIDVYLTNMKTGKELSLEIRKESDGSVVSSWTKSVPFTNQIPTAWMTVAYEAPYVTVTPETEYGIYLEVIGDADAQWGYSGANPYARGQAKGFSGDDFLFQVWGVKDAVPAETNVSATVVVDDSIKSPILVSAEKQGKDVELKKDKDVVLAANDKLVLSGTSFTGAGVAITLDDKEYTATVAPDGSWNYTISAFNLKAGTYTVKGQAYKDGKGSEKVDLMSVKVLGAKVSTAVAPDRSWFAGWNIFFTLTGVGLLLLVLLLLSLIARRHHGEKTGGKEPVKKDDKEEVIESTEEVVEEPKIVKGKKSKNK